MTDKPFHFRQFDVLQSRSAMKVGTDAVLIAAWTRVEHAHKILDVGTGTGVIALLCAQRNSTAHIDAIEMDTHSAEDAEENFHLSPWSQRLNLIRGDFLSFTFDSTYDLVISNPPYFSHSLRAADPSRNAARHDDTLPSSEFLRTAAERLSDQGRVAVIFPKPMLERWSEEAAQVGLHPIRICHVFTLPTKDSVRVMVEFSKGPWSEPEMDTLLVEKRPREFADSYRQLVKDYFLKY